jgi:hypothetical protein
MKKHLDDSPIPFKMKVSKLFFDTEDHEVVLNALRTSNQIAHVESGNVFLIAPDGEVNMVCTKWYAAAWCTDHKDWSFRPL